MNRAERILTDNNIKFSDCFIVDKNLLEKYYHMDKYYPIFMEAWIYYTYKNNYYIYKIDIEEIVEINEYSYLSIKKDYDKAWEWYQTW